MNDTRAAGAGSGLGAKPPRLRVAVLLARSSAAFPGRGDEMHEYPGTAAQERALMAAARAAGFDAFPVCVSLDDVDAVLERLECDAILNLCDGSGPAGDGLPGLEALAAIERRGLPYTGARPAFYAIGSDKVAMKRRFRARRLPTPDWQVFRAADEALAPELAAGPLFVKPCDGGASVGVDLGSVVAGEAELRARIAEVCATYGQALVERFVDGRELTIGVLDGPAGPQVLPPLEVLFGAAFPPGRGIRTFASKFVADSSQYNAVSVRCPAALSPALERRLRELALAAYAAVDGSGYGRVDVRLDARDEPFVLEVNPACSLEWTGPGVDECAMFPLAARAAGFEFVDLLRALVDEALRRARGEARRPDSAPHPRAAAPRGPNVDAS